jgi:TolA-binding protein
VEQPEKVEALAKGLEGAESDVTGAESAAVDAARYSAAITLVKSALEKNDYKTALQNLQKVEDIIEPADLPEWWYLSGMALQGLDRPEDAGLAFMRVVIHYAGQKKSTPHYAECMIGSAEVHVKMGRKDVARSLYEEVLRSFPDTPQAEQAKAGLAKLG